MPVTCRSLADVDIALWARVVWRFKWISAAGLLLACVLAVLSTARVSFAGGKPQFRYRTPVIYTADARILVTQAGFPWGRTILPSGSPTDTSTTGTTPSYADPSRFSM